MHADATKLPDAGAMTWSDDVARSGGITIGARPILVAYNVNVDEQGAAVARKIGSIVRSSGRLLKSLEGENSKPRNVGTCSRHGCSGGRVGNFTGFHESLGCEQMPFILPL